MPIPTLLTTLCSKWVIIVLSLSSLCSRQLCRSGPIVLASIFTETPPVLNRTLRLGIYCGIGYGTLSLHLLDLFAPRTNVVCGGGGRSWFESDNSKSPVTTLYFLRDTERRLWFIHIPISVYLKRYSVYFPAPGHLPLLRAVYWNKIVNLAKF